ncbi:HAD-like domain protein [Kalmanozyma brasiliensis GHG001]|uniref:Epoxide hydrolase n=1 Tax=Kalmanozyma brasiliensis (strain GHG001) TaxID=1365824 RepID=V5GQP6_KALBG|nr:HAD-like domain protein [Kalmanozyma brasiliensis GHG001]EST08272.1 HAD-like domain protein [Kalmanozyma brasiliensis GHG001]
MTFKAVIFDIGGVVVASPLFAINRYEEEHGLPFQYLNVAITAQGHGGAFQKFERSELDIYTFYRQFGEELSNVEKNNEAYTKFCKSRGQEVPKLPTKLHVDGRDLFGRMMRQSTQVDPRMRTAITRLKASGKFKIAALTNNFAPPTQVAGGAQGKAAKAPSLDEELEHLGLGNSQNDLRKMFDLYIESAVVGLRKPDPEFYKHALDLLKVQASDVVFLDDIGPNLKAAQKLGITTIRVNSTDCAPALAELAKLTGVQVLDADAKRAAKL